MQGAVTHAPPRAAGNVVQGVQGAGKFHRFVNGLFRAAGYAGIGLQDPGLRA